MQIADANCGFRLCYGRRAGRESTKRDACRRCQKLSSIHDDAFHLVCSIIAKMTSVEFEPAARDIRSSQAL
jgi:hypothetical protein